MNTTTFANGYPGPASRQAQKSCEVKPLMGYQPPPSTNIYNLIVFKCMYVIYMLGQKKIYVCLLFIQLLAFCRN